MEKASMPRISFGIMVLNGEPFTRYCLRSLYPFAYEIIVVEGGHEDAKSVCTPDGHSVDGTLETLHKFKKDEDPENKLTIVTRDGFWPKKDELGNDRTPQSRAYAEIAKGDFLWQVDIDEFYKAEDMTKIIQILQKQPSITTISFPIINFWGDIIYKINGWKSMRGDAINVHRLFKWGENYKYLTHEPPTILNQDKIDLRKINWIKGKEIKKKGIFIYHYSHLFPWQVRQKILIYKDEKPINCADIVEWAENNYFKISNPFNIERHYWLPSWLERYTGEHPAEVIHMMNDIRSEIISNIELRNNTDAEAILNNKNYLNKVSYMKIKNYWDYYSKFFIFHISRIKNVPRVVKRNLFKVTT